MGKALREGFIVPLPLAEEFFALIRGESLGPQHLPRPGSGTAGEFLGVMSDFVTDLLSGEAGLSHDEAQARRKELADRRDFSERFLSHDQPDASPHQPMSFNDYLAATGACFVETGFNGPCLCPNGENISVSIDNVQDFVEQATRFWFDTGIAAQIEAFKAGLNDVFPIGCLLSFSREELREMFCGEDKIEWDEQALLNHIHPTGGLHAESPTYKNLIAVLLEMNNAERARFLDFVTSCPRLPPGGIAKFHMDVFPEAMPSKQAYPRSRACANQLYLPQYNTKEELYEKLHEAMHSSAGHHEQKMRDL